MTQQDHFLIIGGGVGGLCLAYHLLERGASVTLIDRDSNHSSAVAAGMINPLVFRRMTKSWRADELIPFAGNFYRNVETQTNTSFFHPIVIRRFFSSDQERGFWMDKQHEQAFTAYMEPLTDDDLNYNVFRLKNDFGSGRVLNASWVNTPVFLSALRKLISERAEVITKEFSYDDVDPVTGSYHNTRYTGIIFATGFENKLNAWFASFPVQTTKGEVLTIKHSALPEDFSVNRKCFVLPIGNSSFRIGATYAWDDDKPITTPEGKKEILEKLTALTDEIPEVIDHLAGIRPTSPDRRPIIGRHPQFKHLYLFNGLGTKGYMIAPLLSNEFAGYLNGENDLSPEVDLIRFLK